MCVSMTLLRYTFLSSVCSLGFLIKHVGIRLQSKPCNPRMRCFVIKLVFGSSPTYRIPLFSKQATTPFRPPPTETLITYQTDLFSERQEFKWQSPSRFLRCITCQGARTGGRCNRSGTKDICACRNDNWNVHSQASVKIYVPQGLLLQ